MQDPIATIRRRSNGSIDTDYYIDRALTSRRDSYGAAMTGGPATCWVLAAAAVVLMAIVVTAPRLTLTPVHAVVASLATR